MTLFLNFFPIAAIREKNKYIASKSFRKKFAALEIPTKTLIMCILNKTMKKSGSHKGMGYAI